MESKKKYIKPRIEIIFLDNEISLSLESTPPIGPNEVYVKPDSNVMITSPFKSYS